jgi:hypothetical protein
MVRHLIPMPKEMLVTKDQICYDWRRTIVIIMISWVLDYLLPLYLPRLHQN